MGKIHIDNALDKLATFAKGIYNKWQAPTIGSINKKITFTLEEEEWSLSGTINDARENGLLSYRFSKMENSSRYILSLWIRHLFFSACAHPDAQNQTECWFRDGRIIFSPCSPDEAISHLTDLMTLFRKGLAEPLRFYPNSSLAYVTSNENISKAYSKWDSSPHVQRKGEKDNKYNALATRGLSDILDDEFTKNAKKIFEPMTAKMTRIAD
jgi:exodeoxyribonuclease V gamma subunit